MTHTFVLTYDRVPKSVNAGGSGSRRHWSVGWAEKQEWEGIWLMLLLVERVPKHMSRVRVTAQLEFKHANRRDEENFRPAITKPFADALVKGGYIPDDTGESYKLTDVVILKRRLEHPNPQVKGRITLSLEAEYPDDLAA